MSGLLSRWNQRRTEVAKEAEQSDADVVQDELTQNASGDNNRITAEPEDVAASLDSETYANREHADLDTTDANTVSAEELPDPNLIEVGGSFASFMAKNVDPATKAAALKALWKQPQYGHIDGLLEYALDYTNQPKLSAEMSAELAKKVFKHVIEKQDVAEEDEEMLVAQGATSSEQLIPDDTMIDNVNASVDVDHASVSTEAVTNIDANNALIQVAQQPDELQSHTITGDAVITG